MEVVVLSSDLGKQRRAMLSVDWRPDWGRIDGLR